ncbi:hypothetical protein BDQ17DRAFT_1423096 [Cyathus striatus]|nr:hypothetical protein BDQ17DRAFT_1423096 [Cyathus striatus]
MFKKPLGNLKTSAPLRGSDRRKLKQRVIAAFNISQEDADLLVPDGILSVKFSTHLNEPGLAYLSPNGDPCWFTIGKGSEDLVPSIYSLWKKTSLLPFLSTPSAVIPILVGGADLMIPGVIHSSPGLPEGALVSVRQLTREDGKPMLSPPLAVGRMALPSDLLREGGREKGKAVHVLHTWKDHLWDMGAKGDVPPGDVIEPKAESSVEDAEEEGNEEDRQEDKEEVTPPTPAPAPESATTYTSHEISVLLTKSLLQAISSISTSLTPPSFPMPATQFYTACILPSRPAFPTLALQPASLPSGTGATEVHIDPQEINVKSSSHKSLTAFLKSAEKAGLVNTKSPQKHSAQTEVLVMAVNTKHEDVDRHSPFVTFGDVEAKKAKKEKKEEREREERERKAGEVEVRKVWKPHVVGDIFEAVDARSVVYSFYGIRANESRTSNLYGVEEIRALVGAYITKNNLVNPRDQALINLDPLLLSAVMPSKSKKKGVEEVDAGEVKNMMKRDEITKKIIDKMQPWYEVKAEGRDPVCKKGSLKPIQVVTKIRQGRKASTLITGFEPFLVVEAEEMAEDLRKVCAGATSVSPVIGKPAGSGMEVLVQGKQGPAVVEYLTGKGIPKRWIDVQGMGKK